MQAQRYGTLPIAHAVGGLIDTIDDNGTGFLFPDLTADRLLDACRRAFEVFADPTRLATMRRAAMARCFTWSASAADYAALYRRHCHEAPPRRVARPAATPRRVEMDLEAAA